MASPAFFLMFGTSLLWAYKALQTAAVFILRRDIKSVANNWTQRNVLTFAEEPLHGSSLTSRCLLQNADFVQAERR